MPCFAFIFVEVFKGSLFGTKYSRMDQVKFGRQPLKTLKGYGLLKQMLCYLQFRFKQYFCEEEHQLTTSSFLFFLKKNRPKKQKKISNIRYLIMLLISMRPVIFLVFSQYGLACKYGIIFKYQYIIGCRIAFSDTYDFLIPLIYVCYGHFC